MTHTTPNSVESKSSVVGLIDPFLKDRKAFGIAQTPAVVTTSSL